MISAAQTFCERTSVALANLTRQLGGFGGVTRSELAQLVAMTPVSDLDGQTLEHLAAVERATTPEVLQGTMLRAFWTAFLTELPEPSVEPARLYLNPPLGLSVGGPACMTLGGQPWLSGRYGFSASVVLPNSVSYNVDGTTRGFFDDVTVFWDAGISVPDLLGWVMPGTTFTFLRPNRKVHAGWVRRIGLDLGFATLITGLETSFKLVEVECVEAGNIEKSAVGLESK